MFLSEIHLDGFKSYAQRTVINGWDPEFNAITGLNGSGKSNILDAICFVLGISNLSQVRASNLQDLVYKQGQAGITKATVTLVFNNSDSKQSPIGYEQHDTITVSRQVIIGGRNKYMVNGHTVQQSNVQNLFQSVGLNVNNPHFLIMQGRITKVLNMKPKETLGLIEEAAGTRMFEVKKEAAVKTIEKKQEKVDQINKVLKDEITPTLEKLQRERAEYLKWAASNTECERLSRLCTAWEYTQAEQLKSGSADAIAKLHADIAASTTQATDHRASAEAIGVEIMAQDAKLAAARSGENATLADKVDQIGRDMTKSEAAYKSRNNELGSAEKARDGAVKAAKDGEAAREKLAATQAKARAEAQAAQAEAKTLSETVATLNKKLLDVRAGLSGEADGKGTVADQLRDAKARVTSLNTEIKKGELNAKVARDKVKDTQVQLKREEKDGASYTAALNDAARKLEERKAALAKLAYKPETANELKKAAAALQIEISKSEEQYDNGSSQLGPYMHFQYDRSGMGSSWDPRRVKGTVANLISVKRPEAAVALEVVAGGKLVQVVVDNDETGKLLLERGKLTRRVTLVPLTTIRGRAPRPEQIAAAAKVSGGKAVPALSCVAASEPSYQRVLEYVFGAAFVCDTPEVAKAIAFDPAIRCLAVTLAGDVFDPAGTLEGGSAPGQSGQPMLMRIAGLRELRARLEKSKSDLAGLEAQIASTAKAEQEYTVLADQVDNAQHALGLVQQRMAGSSLGQLQTKLKDLETQAAAEDENLARNKKLLGEFTTQVKSLEAELQNAAAVREQRVKAVESELDKTRKAAEKASEKEREKTKVADDIGFQLDNADKATAEERATINAHEAAVSKLRDEVHKLSEALAALKAQHTEAKTRLAEAQAAIAAADKARQKLVRDREKELGAADDSDRETRRLEGEVKKTQAAAAVAEKTVADLMVKHPWIATERSSFGAAHSDYDFKRNDPAKAQATLKSLAAEQAKREKNINKKVMGMIETAEREYNELNRKKTIINNDRDKINKVIAELDEKKNEALRSTWAKVNKDFGSIFTTLLPGTTAKLEPPEGGTVLDGLEVRVAFNGVWKASLTELSGGQRSLLALSLILSLLLFKPAPMYILDEVDAALDLSHTQNIGVMIRRYFSQSQFIVVSLKQGMFSNANVIFRTKFVDGTSTVTRTVPASSDIMAREKAMIEDGENTGAGAGASKAKGKAAAAGKARAGAGASAGGDDNSDDDEVMPQAKRRGVLTDR